VSLGPGAAADGDAPVPADGRVLPHLGDPARIRIVELLSERDHAVHQSHEQITSQSASGITRILARYRTVIKSK
jgi:hypothetical protein